MGQEKWSRPSGVAADIGERIVEMARQRQDVKSSYDRSEQNRGEQRAPVTPDQQCDPNPKQGKHPERTNNGRQRGKQCGD